MPEPAHDALEALRARLAETRAHAEQLADDVAAARANGAGGADDTGATAGEPGAGPRTSTTDGAPDLQALLALVEVLRELVPPELQQQLADVTRQILLLVRALIDFWVDRLEAPPVPAGDRPGNADDPPVEDIPVA
jgi:hypothetical protein